MDKKENILVKIGRGIKKGFFGLINWVKNTAWIQPLLIVGVIFAVFLCIKPFTSWVSGIFNPDESFQFYHDHTVNDMTKLYDQYIKDKDGTVIVIFYGDEDTNSKNVESTIKNYSASNTSIAWYCVDIDDDDTDALTHEKNQNKIFDDFQNTFFDQYAISYEKMPVDMKSSEYEELVISDDDTQNRKIPSPLFARYDDGELIGIRIGLSSSSTMDDLELFVEGTAQEWQNGKLN